MATKIVTKNSSTASAVPTASDLVQGELAVNVADKRLFTEDNGGSIIELGTNPSTIDINAGSIDGTAIGASSASTGAFTTLTATGLTVDTNTLYVDSTNNRVGVGTSSPSVPVHVYKSQASPTIVAKFENPADEAIVEIKSKNTDLGVLQFADTEDANVGAVQYSHSDNSMRFKTNDSERLRIDSSGNVGIGTSSPSETLHMFKATYPIFKIESTSYNGTLGIDTGNGNLVLNNVSNAGLLFNTNNTERARIDSSGNLLVGTTNTAPASSGNVAGSSLLAIGKAEHSRDGGVVLALNRKTSDGTIAEFRKDGSTVGSIGTVLPNATRYFYISGNSSGVGFYSSGIYPSNNTGGFADNSKDLGSSTVRWDDVYATNGTIQTSDRNEKQDIAELSEAEQRVAVAAKGLLRKFRWKDSVAEKGDDARIHFGIIAQDLQAAFEAEGLDAGDYAMFISSTWTDEETNEEKTRMGVRYSELLAFIISAI